MKKRLLVTAHGIRTYGGWQPRLETLISKQVPELAKEIEFVHLNYGFFSFLQYILPPLRFVKVRCAPDK